MHTLAITTLTTHTQLSHIRTKHPHTHTHTHTQQEYISKDDNDVVLNVIDKDLDRMFPTHVLFQKAGSQGYVTNLHCSPMSTVRHSSSAPPGKQTSTEC